ncbi:MAG: Holliday junction branch migration protein RuvA [Candidatus Gracilibacteria bacterium]|nr:Holliday junction branch migration protein RuvA [Candidatus Gracilibacteria bacterium]
MIGYLHGTVIQQLDQALLLLVNGVGYKVRVTTDLYSKLINNEEMSLFIHTQVKEDDISLYGFLTIEEMSFFQQLISVSGIGPKTGLGILDMPLGLVQQAIENEDLTYLAQAPGLGKKTAARLALELKGKLKVEIAQSPQQSLNKTVQEEAMEALLNLGYEKGTVIRFLNAVDESFESAEQAVMSFLQNA